MEAAVAELKAQQDAYDKRTEELKAKSEGGGVAALRAKNELAQHLGEGNDLSTLCSGHLVQWPSCAVTNCLTSADPLPLRRAKITQEAALKKAEKLRAPFEAATKQAEEAR